MPKSITLMIIEDEEHNLRMLRGMTEKLRPNWKIVGAFGSVKSTLEYLQNHQQPDLILLDIQLSDGISFSIFNQIEIDSKVIFTTAYDNYAIQAFKVNSIDYLLKPIKEEELEAAFSKFEKMVGKNNANLDYAALVEALQIQQKKFRSRFLVKGSQGYTKVDIKEVAYFYSENKISFAVTYTGKEHVIDEPLEQLETELDPELFFRANRQFLVHVDAVLKIEDYFGGKLAIKVHPPFKETVVISRLKATAFKVWMGK